MRILYFVLFYDTHTIRPQTHKESNAELNCDKVVDDDDDKLMILLCCCAAHNTSVD